MRITGKQMAAIGGLTALLAVALLPPRLVSYQDCCYGPGIVPGVSCCGQADPVPGEHKLVAYRPCCEPYVFVSVDVEAELGHGGSSEVSDSFAFAVTTADLPTVTSVHLRHRSIANKTGPPPLDILSHHVRLNT